jgi:O-antigen/teichoic acid export membrane protein
MIVPLLTRLSKNTFIRGSFIFTSASFLVSIGNYLFNLLMARGFSLSDYGEYMSAFSYIAILAVPFSALNVILINRISRAKVEDRATVAKSIESWIFATLITHKYKFISICILLFSFFYLKTNLLVVSVLFILITTLLNLFTTFYTSALQAYKAFFIAGILSLGVSILKIAFGTAIVFYSPKIDWIYALIVILSLLGNFVGSKLLLFKHKVSSKKSITFRPIQQYLVRKQILLPTITMLGIIGMLNIDVIIVKKFFDAEQAGLYAGLSLLGKVILYATGPLTLVSLTFFSGSEHTHNKKNILLFSALLSLFIGGCASVIYYLFSDLVVQVIFGAKFSDIGQYVWLTAVFGSLYSVVSLLAQYAVTKLRYFSAFSIVALAAQVLGLYLFHNSFYDVLRVNTVVMLCVAVFYSICILKDAK